MQATATLNPSNRRKLIPLVAAIGLLAVLSVIAYVNWNSSAQSEAAQRPAAASVSQAAAEARVRAINELPASLTSDRPAIIDHRFLDINVLPEAQSVSSARPSIADYRFLDMNILPEARVAAGTLSGQALFQFLERNLVMPGSDAEAYYPAIDRDGRPN